MMNSLKGKWWDKNNAKKAAFFLLILLLEIAIAIIVYTLPDRRAASTILMILPVLIAGLMFDLWEGVIFGLVGAILLGPSFTVDNRMQLPWHSANWLLVTAILPFIGGFSAYLKTRALEFSFKYSSIMAVDPYSRIQDRDSFFRRIDQSLQHEQGCSVALIEIKNKDKITSLLGYEVYDDLIKQLLQILESKLPEAIPLYSLEIGILGVSAGTHIEEYANEIIDFFENPVESLGIPVVCELIIGIAKGPQDGRTADELVKNALFALEESRKTIKPISYYADIKQPPFFILPLICELNEALKNNDITFQYQPIIDVHKEFPTSVEALLRWTHPKYGPIPPQDFIYSLESTTFINKLTFWAMEHNAPLLLELQESQPNVKMAINISVANLQRDTFSSQIEKILEENRIPPELLIFEITERGLLTEYEEILHNLAHLHEMGIGISIDDFGTGNTTIETISKVHIDSIKLDKVFFTHFREDPINQKIVSGIINLDQNLDITTIAEGIEDLDTIHLLIKLGVDSVQGYYFARPMDFDKVKSWLKERPYARLYPPNKLGKKVVNSR
ncbi:MAG: c-di-GMP phosphodiesterase Gmr [Chloroflexota bacterium]|nr:c-di-GMP phosphodiesterase Gmr [Chloroflexota bacterium]